VPQRGRSRRARSNASRCGVSACSLRQDVSKRPLCSSLERLPN
jgi:hypothetical protein